VFKVAGALLFSATKHGLSELVDYCKKLPQEELDRILDAAVNARENRRQKSPRALEHADFTFEILADFGSYRDLHRHRTLTQERQLLTCDYGYYMPQELQEANVHHDYIKAMETAKEAFDAIRQELPEEAQYIVPMGYNVRWYFACNLRALQWMCELRSAPAGHPSYRLVAQKMAKEVFSAMPQFERFFKFVDFEGYDLGRLDQEQRKAAKLGLE
jgi:thymidylate synthase ThyX